MQPPQVRQTSDCRSNGVPMRRDSPRPAKPMALATICSSHILTQRPQRMQSSCSCRKRCCRTSWAEARSWIVFDCGQDARSSSMTIFRARTTRAEAVRTFCPSSAT